jgi:hypothetical protein
VNFLELSRGLLGFCTFVRLAFPGEFAAFYPRLLIGLRGWDAKIFSFNFFHLFFNFFFLAYLFF